MKSVTLHVYCAKHLQYTEQASGDISEKKAVQINMNNGNRYRKCSENVTLPDTKTARRSNVVRQSQRS
jgi:hypothetical protein